VSKTSLPMPTPSIPQTNLNDFPANFVDALNESVKPISFSAPITHVYNPIEYAREAHVQYLHKYAKPSAEVIMLGMNPGPWGMAQTGVPYGEISFVRDWLGISAEVGRPSCEHSKRPVLGFACQRSEVSGKRLWGWARDSFGTPTRFFKRYFVANYCPLVFMESSGRNFTPDKLPAAKRKQLFAVCDESLRQLVHHLQPRYVIGVGVFAEKRAQAALEGVDVLIGRILHPSPASPQANRNWASTITKQLADYGLATS